SLHCCHRGSRSSQVQHGGHTQGTETKGLEEKLDDETSVSAGFSGIKGGTYYYLEINLCFLILSCLIFVSNVDRGILSFAAAPTGPATFPLHSAKAASIISLSWFWRVSDKGPANSGRGGCTLASQAFSIQKVSPLHKITERSTMFCSSRIFPGQGYDWHSSSVFLSILRICLPVFSAYRLTKYSTNIEMSSFRLRRGGTS